MSSKLKFVSLVICGLALAACGTDDPKARVSGGGKPGSVTKKTSNSADGKPALESLKEKYSVASLDCSLWFEEGRDAPKKDGRKPDDQAKFDLLSEKPHNMTLEVNTQEFDYAVEIDFSTIIFLKNYAGPTNDKKAVKVANSPLITLNMNRVMSLEESTGEENKREVLKLEQSTSRKLYERSKDVAFSETFSGKKVKAPFSVEVECAFHTETREGFEGEYSEDTPKENKKPKPSPAPEVEPEN